MIIDYKNKLIFLATTKTASTSIETQLRKKKYCGFVGEYSALKHIDLNKIKMIQNALNIQDFKVWCVIRHPVDKSISWYNYRSRDQIKTTNRYLGNKSYKEYLNSMTTYDLNEHNDSKQVFDDRGNQADIVFDFNQRSELLSFLNHVYGISSLPKLNSSASYGMSYNPSDTERDLASKILKSEIMAFNKIKTNTFKEAILTLSKKSRAFIK